MSAVDVCVHGTQTIDNPREVSEGSQALRL